MEVVFRVWGEVCDGDGDGEMVEVFQVQHRVEGRWIRDVDWWNGRWAVVVGVGDCTLRFSSSAGTNVNCIVWVTRKDEGTIEKTGGVVVEDGGNVRVFDKESKGRLDVLADSAWGKTGDVEAGGFGIAGEDDL